MMSTENISGLVMDRPGERTEPNGIGTANCAIQGGLTYRNDRDKGIKYKVFQTAFVVLGPVVMGLFVELIGPTLTDLMHKVHSNYETISRALVVRSAGHILSSIAGGIISSKLKDDVGAFLSLAFLLGAIGTVGAPWCSTLLLLTLCLFLQGLANGTIDTLSTFFCTRLWEQKAALPLHALHFGYGVGALIAPQLSLPFVAGHVKFLNTSTNNASNGDMLLVELNRNMSAKEQASYAQTSDVISGINMSATDFSVSAQLSRIEIPYGISGLFAAVLSISFAAFYLNERCSNCRHNYHIIPKKNLIGAELSLTPQRHLFSGCCKNNGITLQTLYLIVMFCILFNCNAGLSAFSKFLYVFATEGDLNMSHDLAASLNSAFWLAFTCGRGMGLVLSQWISPNIMLCVELAVNITSAVLLFIWGDGISLMLWINTCLFGMSIGPIIPTVFACANLYTRLNGVVVSVLFISIASGPLTSQWLTGYLFQLFGPRVHMPITLVYSIITSALVTVLLALLRNKRERFDSVIEIDVTSDEKKDTSVLDR